MNKIELTFGDIIKVFGEQFPNLQMYDCRPNGMNELYIWIDHAPTNIIATYDPATDTFTVKTTREPWVLLKTLTSSAINITEELTQYCENDVKITRERIRESLRKPRKASSGCEAQFLDD